ncbi:MAG: transposase, partial [Nitrosopumilus sp. (ex Thoosa mismalolli)]|nr:transposase [Nitrosopumilus sp. (ex Thoosa mismalolli)]
IPHRRTKKKKNDKSHNGKNRRDAVRYVVERFFSWLKNGFHRLRIRYERKSENYLAFANIASFMMYFRVLG